MTVLTVPAHFMIAGDRMCCRVQKCTWKLVFTRPITPVQMITRAQCHRKVCGVEVAPTSPEQDPTVCGECGTWVCHECWEFRRQRASRSEHQICGRCGGTKGKFLPTRHIRNSFHHRRGDG